MPARHSERHRGARIGWLRASVLGANDGIVSTASLLVGVVAANTSHSVTVLTGVAGLVAGAMSMAAGEYVSVHAQADTERADLERERAELAADPAAEQRELAGIYVGRGLTPELAQQVAAQLSARDALASHVRDELGHSTELAARPVQAALASAGSFAAGAALPLLVAIGASGTASLYWIFGTSLLALAALGAVSARAGGADVWKATWRVSFWGVLAMAVTAVAGRLFGAVG
jgi:vacuolar iron transporter family protein